MDATDRECHVRLLVLDAEAFVKTCRMDVDDNEDSDSDSEM